MENTSDSFMPRPLLFCLKSGRSVCYSVPDNTAALEEPLQSKAIFFDNKKMLQKSQACDGVTFMFARINTMYCSKQFKVKIVVNKDYCILKFTEYTMEEDIIHVLFSLIGTARNAG